MSRFLGLCVTERSVDRELVRCSPVPEIVVEAKLGIKRVKRAHGP